MSQEYMLQEQTFLDVIKHTPLVSIDLIFEDRSGKVLLGKRVNRPAQGYWFVPGGRIRKNEKIANAFRRIVLAELGVMATLADADLLGAFDHIYDDNCFGADGVNTHYVVLAYRVPWQDDWTITKDSQHTQMRWWSLASLSVAEEVHENTRLYFTGAVGR